MHRDSNEVISSLGSFARRAASEASEASEAPTRGRIFTGRRSRSLGWAIAGVQLALQDDLPRFEPNNFKKYRAVPLIYGVQFSLFGCSRMGRSLRRLSTKNRRAVALSYFLQIASPK
jgi:hypothetical protein